MQKDINAIFTLRFFSVYISTINPEFCNNPNINHQTKILSNLNKPFKVIYVQNSTGFPFKLLNETLFKRSPTWVQN